MSASKANVIQGIVWAAADQGLEIKRSTVNMLFSKPLPYLQAVSRACRTEEGKKLIASFCE